MLVSELNYLYRRETLCLTDINMSRRRSYHVNLASIEEDSVTNFKAPSQRINQAKEIEEDIIDDSRTSHSCNDLQVKEVSSTVNQLKQEEGNVEESSEFQNEFKMKNTGIATSLIPR